MLKNFFKNIITSIFVFQMRQIIKKHQPKIVAVVGSVGKTGTKYATATILRQKYRVVVQDGNYNTPISVPFIFLGRSLPALRNPFGWLAAWLAGQKIVWGKYPYDIVVVELGTDKPGDMADFQKIIHPDIAVVTAISDEHMDMFGTLDNVAKEEFTITQFCDILVYNNDDILPNYTSQLIPASLPSYSYGFLPSMFNISAQTDGFSYTVQVSGEAFSVQSKVDLVAKHSLKPVAAAVVVAKLLGLTEPEIVRGMASIHQPPGRMHLLAGIKNSTIIDDTYNSSPLAAAAALQTLYEKLAPQKIVLLGNMNELGETSQNSHEAIAKICDPKQLDLVVTLGVDANKYIPPIAEALGCLVMSANTPYEAAAIIADGMKDGALVLCKGSQNGVFAEEAVKMLLADPNDDIKLVRQTKPWLAKKQAVFNKMKS